MYKKKIEIEKEENIVRRNGAKPNDLLVVTGDLGGAYMGLQILEREHAVFLANPNMQPEMEGFDYILERQLKPEARTDVKGILEYAETEDGTKYTIKSWTNSSMIAVMYVASKKEVNINFQEIYFNGFRFKK